MRRAVKSAMEMLYMLTHYYERLIPAVNFIWVLVLVLKSQYNKMNKLLTFPANNFQRLQPPISNVCSQKLSTFAATTF